MMREGFTPDAPLTETPSVAGLPARSGHRLASTVVVLGLLGVAGFIGLRLHQAKDKQAAIATERQVVQAAVAQKVPSPVTHPVAIRWRPRVDVTGTLRPWREADIGFELGGRMVKVGVAQGDKVKSGQTLGVLDGSRAQAEVGVADAQARASAAALSLAQDNLRRADALYATSSIPLAQLEEVRAQVTLARAQLEGSQASARVARAGQGLHTIKAPFDGVVTKAPTAAGSVVQPGTALFRVEDLSRLRLSATFGEDEATLVAIGAPVSVQYRDRQVSGKLITLVPSLDQATRRAPVEVEVPNDPKAPLLAYGFVHAVVEGAHEVDALQVPQAARRPGSQDEVVKVVDGKAKIVHVDHTEAADGSWIVLRGLTTADTLALNPPDDVHDGDPIELARDLPQDRAH